LSHKYLPPALHSHVSEGGRFTQDTPVEMNGNADSSLQILYAFGRSSRNGGSYWKVL